MTATIRIPEHPTDGYRVYFWRVDARNEGLTHHRVTYIANRPCHEVTGCEVGRGVPYVDEWYRESCYVPNEPYWRGNGRSKTEDVAFMFKRRSDPEIPDYYEIYATFEDARAALFVCLDAMIAAKRREADRLQRIRDRFPTQAPEVKP